MCKQCVSGASKMKAHFVSRQKNDWYLIDLPQSRNDRFFQFPIIEREQSGVYALLLKPVTFSTCYVQFTSNCITLYYHPTFANRTIFSCGFYCGFLKKRGYPPTPKKPVVVLGRLGRGKVGIIRYSLNVFYFLCFQLKLVFSTSYITRAQLDFSP